MKREQKVNSKERVVKRKVNPPVLFVLMFIFCAVCSCENPIIRDHLKPFMDERAEDERRATTYTVTFNSMGGSEVLSQDIRKGGRINRPTAPILAYYEFSAWFREDACINEWNFDTGAVTEHLTLYAGWRPVTYTVSFDSMGGSSMNPISNITHNTSITRPADPARPGFGFDGWFKDLGLTDEWNFAGDTVTESIMLYAKWTRNALDVSLEMENITNINPEFDPIVISRSAAAPYYLTAIVYVEDEAEYEEGSVKWEVQGVGTYAAETISGTGANFTLDASDERYNTPGGHILKLEVKQNGITYRINIPFTIVN